MVKSEPTWACPKELRFEAKQLLLVYKILMEPPDDASIGNICTFSGQLVSLVSFK